MQDELIKDILSRLEKMDILLQSHSKKLVVLDKKVENKIDMKAQVYDVEDSFIEYLYVFLLLVLGSLILCGIGYLFFGR